MITVKAFIAGSWYYYKCDHQRAAEELVIALDAANIEASIL